MSEIKIGSKVKRIGNTYWEAVEGGVYVVQGFMGNTDIYLEGCVGSYGKAYFKVVEDILSPSFSINQSGSCTTIEIVGTAEIKVLKRLTISQCEELMNIINKVI